MKKPSRIAAALIFCSSVSMAQAGIVEDLLAIPAIRSLLGRVPELQAVVQRCGDPAYNQRNTNICREAEQANRLSRVPPELRTVLSNPTTAASLRELCLAAQPNITRNNYLCLELAKADTAFSMQVEQQRMQQNRENTDR